MELLIWLLNRFGVLERNESLYGDLLEERAAGRSFVWLLGQTLAAIGETAVRDWREHWVLALRAIVAGWILNWNTGEVIQTVSRHEPVVRAPGALLKILLVFAFAIWPAFLGRIIAWSHRARPAAMVLAFVASEVTWTVWHLTVHYNQLHEAPVQNQWTIDLILNCGFILFTLAGGLLTQPGRRIV